MDPEKPVLVAGDPERSHESKVKEEGGIWYHDNLIAAVVSASVTSSLCKLLLLPIMHIRMRWPSDWGCLR